MQIKKIEGYTGQALAKELERGGKFIVYQYCISILVMTFRRSSDVYFIKGNESKQKYGWGLTLLTLLFGWWGIPWGPIYTIGSIGTNLSGGKDVTNEVMNRLMTKKEAA